MDNIIDVTGRAAENLKALAASVAGRVLELTGQPSGLEVAIRFVSENEIKTLNREIRGVDRVTDVLSFPSFSLSVGEVVDLNSPDAVFLKNSDGTVHFGDMALCTKVLRSQAKSFGNSCEAELKKLVIHSMLHLMGYDHIEDDDYEIMNKKEKELDKLID